MRLKNYENINSGDIRRLNDEDIDPQAQEFEASQNMLLFESPTPIDEPNELDELGGLGKSNSELIEEMLHADLPTVLKELERLKIRDAFDVVCKLKPGEVHSLERRLDFYERLLRGEVTEDVIDYNNYNIIPGKYGTKKVVVECDADSVRVGLFRNLKQALMKGTPENAISRMVTKFIIGKLNDGTNRVSFNSRLSEHSYEDFSVLNDLYHKQRMILEGKPLSKEMTEDQKEHKAILMAQDVLIEASKYNSRCRGPESPYTSSLQESIAWAQLGDGVKAQFSGMRNKIQGVDLHNIGRFEGKSGVSKYDRKAYRLKKQIEFLTKEAGKNEKIRLTAEYNLRDIDHLEQDYIKKIQVLEHKYEKIKSNIQNRELPDEERTLQFQGLELQEEKEKTQIGRDHEIALGNITKRRVTTPEEFQQLEDEYQRRKLSLEKRKGSSIHNFVQGDITIDVNEWYLNEVKKTEDWHSEKRSELATPGQRDFSQLITDLEKELGVTKDRCEKNKSIAQMALDLHWHFNGHANSLGADFINSVAFGDIKRAYKLMKLGGSNIDVLTLAKTSTFLDDEGVEGDYKKAFHKAKKTIVLDNSKLKRHYLNSKSRNKFDEILKEFDPNDITFTNNEQLEDGLSADDINSVHAGILAIFQNRISKQDRAQYLQECKETGVKNPFETHRLLKIILDLDLNNGESRVTKFMQQADTPDRMWVYFAKKLLVKEFFTKNLSKYLVGPSFPVLRKLLSQSPMDFNTILDSAASLGIDNLAEDGETLFSAMRDIGGVTPEVYKQYKKLQGQERDDFVENIKVLKCRFFGNTPIDQLGVDENIIKEILYLSYKPTNTSYEGVVDYLKKVPDCTHHLSSYTFPQNGYQVEMKDVEVKLRPDTKLKFSFSEFCSMLEDKKDISEKDINQTLMWIAKGSTSPTMDQMVLLMNFLPSEDRQRLAVKIKEAKTDKDAFAVLNSVVEFLGIFAKDNLPKALQEYLDNNEQLKGRLDLTLKQEKYSRLLKRKLGDDYVVRDVSNNVSRLVVGLFQFEQQKAKKDIRSFVRSDGSTAAESLNSYKVYLSKNKASFFAKASGGICTADSIDLFTKENHLHFNMVRNDEVVLGNIQGYTHRDTAGNTLLILRGFNPSDSALKEFSAEAFVEAGLKVGREFAKENGFHSLAIVYDDNWHPLSNREQVRQYLANRYRDKGENLYIPSLDISARGKIIYAVKSLPL